MTDANPPVMSGDPIEAVQQWFALMERYCASVDYDGAECYIRRRCGVLWDHDGHSART